MRLLSGDLGASLSQTRREYRALFGLGWADGRQATLWLEIWHAKRRRGTKSELSRYAVSEVKEVGFAGRTFIFDKEQGEPESCGLYHVRIDPHGEAWCKCTAGIYKAPCCRHVDAVLVLLDEGAFDGEELQGF